jgi:hypothetical protein
MKWDRERWRKLYCKEEGDFANLPAMTRGFAALLLKHADDDGRIPLPSGEEPGTALARLVRAHKFEYRQIGAYVTALLADGYLIREPTGVVLRNFARAQGRSSGAERQARFRERQRAGERYSNVTSVSRSHNDVTDRALTLSSISDHDLISDRSGSLDQVGMRAREPDPVAVVESLLEAVAKHDMLDSLRGDRRWAERAAGGLMHQGCRAQDATAAIDAFVLGEAANAPDDGEALDRFVRKHIGGYLKNAKAFGDRTRVSAKGARPAPPIQRGGWSREDAERNRPVLGEGDEV